MDYRFTFTIWALICGTWATHALGQGADDCRWEAAFWTEPVEAQIEEVREGDIFYLSAGYVAHIQRGRYDDVPSGLVQYVYLRPATQQELRRGTVEGHPREEVGPDGNVYVAKPAPGRAHFFRAGPAFAGEMDPHWEDPNLVLPLGLEPVDIGPYVNAPLVLTQKAADYLELEVAGETFYFFRGFPRFGLVFLTREVQARLDDRQRRAARLAGRRWLVLSEADIASRSGQQITLREDYLLQHAQPVFVDSVQVAVDQMQVIAGPASRLMVRAEAPLLFFDRDCVAAQYLDSLTSRLSAEAVLNAELDALARQLAADSALEAAPVLRAALEARFRPDQDGYLRYVFEPAAVPIYTAYVRAWLHERGHLSLQSHYAAPQGLYHTRLILYTPDGDSLFTTRISTLDDRYVRTYLPEGIEEEIFFTEAEDLRLIEAIARHSGGPLRLRFTAGGDFFREISLAPIFQAQIRDTWLMYRLMEQENMVRE